MSLLRLSRVGRSCSPVTCLCLSSPVLCNLVRSNNSSWCCYWSSSWLAISSPVSHCCVSSPVFFVRSNKVGGLHHLALCGCFSLLPLFLLNFLGISVEEEIGHDLPWQVPGDGAPQPENLSGEHPPHQADGLCGLVVARDCNIDELGWGVNIGESHDGDVSVATLSDWLMVSPGVSDQKQPGLAESSLDLISEGSWSEAASNGVTANISGELEDSSLSGGPSGHHVHILWVLNSSNSTGSKDQLLPGLLQVNDVDTAGLLLEDVLLHGSLTVV